MKKEISIAGTKLELHVDQEFTSIQKFLDNLNSTNTAECVAAVSILKSEKRNVKVSEDFKKLLITGADIDNLTNPFNLIGIIQALFRFSAIHLAKKNIFLLHGSAAILNDKLICFGDDGNSTAKTLSSLEVALISNQYVADEFCFFNAVTGKIFGYSFVPIHIRPVVAEHLKTQHDLVLPSAGYLKSEAGYFIQPSDLFKVTSGKLEILAYVHFSDTEKGAYELSIENARESLKCCVATHVAKLLHPELDRMQFASRSDSVINHNVSQEIIDNLAKELFSSSSLEEMLKTITSYRIFVSKPCEVPSLFMAQKYLKHS